MGKNEVLKQIEVAMGLSFPDEQVDIITHKGKASNVISCAGSGKTTLMIATICYMQMFHKVDPSKIIVISFNKSAVDEIAGRYLETADKLGISKNITFKTFHALYYLILNYYENAKSGRDIKIMDDGTSSSLFGKAFYAKSENKSEDNKENMLSLRGYAVNNLIGSSQQLANSPEFITSGVELTDYLSVIKEYKEIKALQGNMDFDDLQIQMLDLLKTTPEARNRIQAAWEYWFIDEYQDISKVQMEILKLSLEDTSKLVTIGDEDQAIYEFRGSKVDYIVDFPIYFRNSKRYVMGTNYRCPEVILKKAEKMISTNRKRVPKKMKAYNLGGKLTYTGFNTCSESSINIAELIYDDFINDVPLSEIVVLYRNNRQQLFIVDQLIQKGIPVKVMRMSNLLHSHQIVSDIRNIIEFALNDTDSHLFSKVFTKITRYMKRTDVNAIVHKMFGSGESWRNFVDMENKSIQETSRHIEVINQMVQDKRTASDIIDEVMKIYDNYLDYAMRTMASTKDEIKDIISYAKYIGSDKTFKQFNYYVERSKSLIEMYAKDKDAVTITTMHTVKGLEYDKVYILDASDNVLPNYKRVEEMEKLFGVDIANDYIEQERRLFYVACTRAKKELYITYDINCPSRFVLEQIRNEKYNISDKPGDELIIGGDRC